jgi:hypothetical protein
VCPTAASPKCRKDALADHKEACALQAEVLEKRAAAEDADYARLADEVGK